MADAQKETMEIPQEIKSLMFQTWLPALMSTVLEEIKKLPEQHRGIVLKSMCKTCEDLAMGGALGIQPGMSWNDYLKFVKEAVPPIGPWTIKQDGDIYDLIYDASIGPDGKPRCHCPLVQLGITEPLPECCDGGADLAARMIESATSKKVEKSEVVDCPLRTGRPVCHYRVHVK